MATETITLTVAQIEDLARRALAARGAHGTQLELAVQSVVDAECDGIQTVGLGYLPIYLGHLQVGKINHDAAPSHAQIAPAVIRVEADAGFAHAAYALAEADFYALAKTQGIAVMSIVDSYSAGVLGWFVQRIAEAAFQVNERNENIGARRLHTVMERLLETVSFEAADRSGQRITVDAAYVDEHLAELVRDEDLSRYIL